ncbi:MAG: esterase [Pseudomonadota bacterium]
MNLTRLSLALAALALPLAAAAQAAGDTAPLAKDLFIRGGFNGWGTDNQLLYKGKGVYETEIVISPGNHAFKVGHKDWSAEWVISPDASVTVAPGTDYKMDPHPGPEDYLFVKKTAAYKFRVDVSDAKAPVLRVVRLESAPVAAIDPHAGHASVVAVPYRSFDGQTETVRYSTPDAAANLRTYAHSSTMQLRDPGPQHTSYTENATLPNVRSGNLAFDALFALAGAEMQQNGVREIRDGNYNGGAAIACDCFETGEKWHYVWTRDLSYAAHLGLAMLDPARVVNSLNFKLSGWRAGVTPGAQASTTEGGLQLVQDTGSGGSWPVSTDRVSWAFGAEAALKALPARERAAFAARALTALGNTIENDRLAAFDPESGLYLGEQSFLDWRDQSYAAWIMNDIASLASSKALSTNVGHYQALTLAARLAAEQGLAARATKYTAWAGALKKAINKGLWLEDAGMYSSLSAPHFDGAPMHKFDWLGQSLAIVTGVADGERARKILARYPHGPMGAPVIYPQQPGIPVYHNRAMWPFVTAYGLKAAALGGNVSVADAAYDTLMRGAALNLSNMENLEWLSGQPLLLDEKNPALIGPVINSKRQLWSVGAYLGMVVENVFGIATTAGGIAVKPFITARLRREAFGASDAITLNKLVLQGHALRVRVLLPKAVAGDGYYKVAAVTLNGARVGPAIDWRQLGPDNTIEIRLGALLPGEQAITRVAADPYSEADAVFGPPEPRVSTLAHDASGHAGFEIAPGKNPGNTVYNIYRDGKLVAAKVAAGAWSDRGAGVGACYAVEAQFVDSGNRSHHSAPQCIGRSIDIAVTDARVTSNIAVSGPNARFAAPHLKDWGKPTDTFTVGPIEVPVAGRWQVQLRYHNGANQINLGISGGVKWLTLSDQAGRVVAQGVVQMPHARIDKANTPLVYSTPLAARLKAGKYRLQLSDFYNMSYLQSNSSFSAAGGVEGPSNRVDLYGVRLSQTR